ncbi:MAG: hypothetical protein ACT4OP_07320 [Actinomycetota bacterium]
MEKFVGLLAKVVLAVAIIAVGLSVAVVLDTRSLFSLPLLILAIPGIWYSRRVIARHAIVPGRHALPPSRRVLVNS